MYLDTTMEGSRGKVVRHFKNGACFVHLHGLHGTYSEKKQDWKVLQMHNLRGNPHLRRGLWQVPYKRLRSAGRGEG